MYFITIIDILKLLSLVFPIYLFVYVIGIAIQGYSIFKFRYYLPLIIFFLIAYLGYGILFIIFGNHVLDLKILSSIMIPIIIAEYLIGMKTRRKMGSLIFNLGLVEEKGIYKSGIWRSRVLLHFRENGICYGRNFFPWNKIIGYRWLGSPANILEFKIQSIMHPFPFKVIIPFQHLEEVEKILAAHLSNVKATQA